MKNKLLRVRTTSSGNESLTDITDPCGCYLILGLYVKSGELSGADALAKHLLKSSGPFDWWLRRVKIADKIVLQPLPSHQNKHRSQTGQEVSEVPVGENMLESPAALSSVTACGIRRVKSEGSLGGGDRDVCQPWGPASFLIILVQHVQKANWGFFSLFFAAKGMLWLKPTQEQVPEMLMPGEAEGLEPDGRTGVSSILWGKVPSSVTKSGVNVHFTVQHGHPNVCRTNEWQY